MGRCLLPFLALQCAGALRSSHTSGLLAAGEAPRASPSDRRASDDNRTVLVAINVHERPDLCERQMQNINRHFRKSNLRPQVLLSCNEGMMRNLSRAKKTPSNVYLNPVVIEKSRFTGSILHGIISNLRYGASLTPFRYALVLSSRSRIFKDLVEGDFVASLQACETFVRDSCRGKQNHCWMPRCEFMMEGKGDRTSHMFWGAYQSTKLARHVQGHGEGGGGRAGAPRSRSPGTVSRVPLMGGPHEGLVLEADTVQRILRFLDEHPEIERDLYATLAPMEEFALHTLAVYLGGRFGYLGREKDLGRQSFYKIDKVVRTTIGFPLET